jgi:Phytanoyl-CoA dioxygenase (PhyH)
MMHDAELRCASAAEIGCDLPADISSNGWPIPSDHRYFAPIEPCISDEGIAHALHTEGFALARGFVPDRLVDNAAQSYRKLHNEFSSSNQTARYGVAGHPAFDFVRSQSFKDLCAHSRFFELSHYLLGGQCTMLNRKIFRHYTGARPIASRAHRDWSYIDYGPTELVVFWVPLTPSDLRTGALVYLEDSRNLDIARVPGLLKNRSDRPKSEKVFTNDLRGLSEMTQRPWRYADVQPGDVLIHDAYIVHASVDCAPDAERISADIRLQRADAEIDERWKSEWSADDGH